MSYESGVDGGVAADRSRLCRHNSDRCGACRCRCDDDEGRRRLRTDTDADERVGKRRH